MIDSYYIADRLTAREARGALHVDLLVAWNLLRPKLGHALSIVSGYRSPDHALSQGREKPSQHTLGRALDVHCPTLNLWSDDMLSLLLECGFRGIGRESEPMILPTGGMRGRFHIDVREGALAFWRYTGNGDEFVRDDHAYKVARTLGVRA